MQEELKFIVIYTQGRDPDSPVANPAKFYQMPLGHLLASDQYTQNICKLNQAAKNVILGVEFIIYVTKFKYGLARTV